MSKPKWLPKFIYNWLKRVLKIEDSSFKLKKSISSSDKLNKDKADFLPFICIKTKDLPSRGLFYPNNAKIKYYPYTFEEVKKFSQSKMEPNERFNFILSGIETNFDKYKLTVSDFIYLGIYRNLSTLETKKINISFECSNCGEDNEVVEKVESFDFDELKDLEVPYIKEFSFGKYEFTPLTVEMIMELIEQKLHEDPLAVATIQTIQDMDSEDASELFMITYNKFKYAKLEDGPIFEEITKELYHSISPKDFICNKCGAKTKVLIDGGDGDVFISPFREPSKSDSVGIRSFNERYSANI